MTLDLNSLSPIQKIEAYKHALRDSYKESLFKTAKYLLGYKDIRAGTHKHICESLQSNTTRKLIVCPRGAFKSSIAAVAYPIWLLINNPNLRILLDSEIFTNSRNFIREIKGHLESPDFIDLFGNWKTKHDWTQSTLSVAARSIIKKESSITAGGVGTVKTGQHFDVIIGDDLNSHKNSATQDGRQKVIEHYRYYTSLLDPGGTIVIIGTRYAEDDVIGYILENEVKHE